MTSGSKGVSRGGAGLITRRALCLAAAGGLLSACGLSGCTNRSRSYYHDLHAGEGWHEGLSVDTEYSDEPVTITIYADECLRRMGEVGYRTVDTARANYAKLANGANATVKFVWYTPSQLESFAAEGIPGDADAFIAQDSVVKTAADNGFVFEGIAYTSVRDFINIFHLDLTMVRKRGSKVEFPRADTLDGNDQIEPEQNLYVTRLAKLDEFDGKLAIAEESERCGIAARSALYTAGLYTGESGAGGKFAKKIADNIKVVGSTRDVIHAVSSGDCKAGLMFANDMTFLASKKLREIYRPYCTYGINFDGGSVMGSDRSAQARDFLQWLHVMQ